MNNRIDQVTNELEQVTQNSKAAFGSLSHDQLNWKSAVNSWSVAQCLDHLIRTNSLYFPLLESMTSGPAKPTRWEQYSPLSGLLGKLLIKTLSPEYTRKVKTIPKAKPSTGEIDTGILGRFIQHQTELAAHLRNISNTVDRKKTIITSPLAAWVTYSLEDCVSILVVHEKRHFQQARRVMESKGFPA